jgi:predicted RNA methylase
VHHFAVRQRFTLPGAITAMKPNPNVATKDLYKRLRTLTCHELWSTHVPRFNSATPQDRLDSVALVRAVGVVFAEDGSSGQKELVRSWLRSLLSDPQEKIRRYALAALPKLGATVADEAAALKLLTNNAGDRELKHLGRTLDKIGGPATLAALESTPTATAAALPQTARKVRASIARTEQPGAIRLDHPFAPDPEHWIHLHCRRGLAGFVRDEVEAQHLLRVSGPAPDGLFLTCDQPFTLANVYALRCFSTLGILLGDIRHSADSLPLDRLADLLTAPSVIALLKAWTCGTVRYRLEFVGRGHLRGAVRTLSDLAYKRCPEILNDSRNALWTIAIYPQPTGSRMELVPRLRPDPRFCYREDDVPAASHPPLAACMARLAGPSFQDEIVWDPFCGSGLELIERARHSRVAQLIGTDLSADAIAAAKRNVAAAALPSVVNTQFHRLDFRAFAKVPALSPNTVSVVVTNPPMGRRVPIPDLPGLIQSLLQAAATCLSVGGRLVFPNPITRRNSITIPGSLRRTFQQPVDLGGFLCNLERYEKLHPEQQPPSNPAETGPSHSASAKSQSRRVQQKPNKQR